MAIDAIDFPGPDGQDDNMGGTTQRLFYARLVDFLVLQTPVASPATFDEVAEIAATHTFKPGKCFKVMYCTEDRGEIKSDIQGDADGHSYKQESESFLPGNSALVHGFSSKSKNDQFIVLREMPDGSLIQQGSAMFPCKCVPSFGSAKNSSGTRGTLFKWQSMGTTTYVYTGTVSLTPAT